MAITGKVNPCRKVVRLTFCFGKSMPWSDTKRYWQDGQGPRKSTYHPGTRRETFMPSTQQEPQAEPQQEPNSVKIEPQAPEPSAAGSAAEDTLKVYEDLIEQMKVQNKTLIKANENLQSQIGLLIRGGGSVGQHAQDPEPQNPTQEPEYTSFADLGKELGKRDYYSHNVKDGG